MRHSMINKIAFVGNYLRENPEQSYEQAVEAFEMSRQSRSLVSKILDETREETPPTPETATCPVHGTEYDVTGAGLEVDCDQCFEASYRSLVAPLVHADTLTCPRHRAVVALVTGNINFDCPQCLERTVEAETRHRRWFDSRYRQVLAASPYPYADEPFHQSPDTDPRLPEVADGLMENLTFPKWLTALLPYAVGAFLVGVIVAIVAALLEPMP